MNTFPKLTNEPMGNCPNDITNCREEKKRAYASRRMLQRTPVLMPLVCRVALLLLLLVPVGCSTDDDGERQTTARMRGSFIQSWMCSGWSDQRWDQEMEAFKQAGMEYIIFTNALNDDNKGNVESLFPFRPDVHCSSNAIERCLRSAQSHNIKVYIGINFCDGWWHVTDGEWLKSQMKVGNEVVDALVKAYKKKYPKAMYGWYWVWEVDNLNWQTSDKQALLAECLSISVAHRNEVTPDMPVMMSPFANYKVGADARQYGAMWRQVFSQVPFRKGDIFVPQDCIGAGGLTLDNVDSWMKEMHDAVKADGRLEFWINVETFTSDARPAPIERIKRQVEHATRFTDNMICFAFSHYNSPYAAGDEYFRDFVSEICTPRR